MNQRELHYSTTNELYVADYNNGRIQKFKLTNPCPTGTIQVVSGVCFVTKWGSQGTGDGQFIGPRHIALDSSPDMVYVSDDGMNRIQVFIWKTLTPLVPNEMPP